MSIAFEMFPIIKERKLRAKKAIARYVRRM